MDNNTVLVLSSPTEPQLAMLEALPPDTGITVGNHTQAFERAAAEATILFNWSGSPALFRDVFQMCSSLRWVHSKAAGLDDVLFPELIASPVPLTNGTGVFSAPLGEFVLGAILFFAKDFRRLLRNQSAGIWEPFDITEIAGQTAGIVGYGDIGRAVATRLRAMGLRVLAARRTAQHSDPLIDRFYGSHALPEMISQCDYVIVTAPLTPDTRGLLGAREFAAMKRTALVVNIGRGPVIDEEAMIGALSEKRILGAALDVFDTEPLPAGHPFFKMENVLLSPHSADHTAEWLNRAMQFFLAQFERFHKGEPLLNVVDKKRGY